ncbi:hypothetical protein B0H63DRAFT_140417 [Podospora didyma]|uniref:Transmembrane protein 53 n=1 Tax=Podospora didyma TaxID=330526 RepID=A0AAE0NS64_9PEZI|nr:hypothetical protein B0H63DRAFT_140417 [Podospora didyma]
MASNAPVAASPAAAAAADPLSFMTRLSPSVYIYRPEPSSSACPSSTSATPASPRLILLASWMGARALHIAKYVRPYQALFPSSPIVLVRSELRHFFGPRSADVDIAAAAPTIRSFFPPSPPQQHQPPSSQTEDGVSKKKNSPELLIHLWSNGGSTALWRVRKALLSNPDFLFPKYTIVFDSSPGQFTYGGSLAAISAGLTGPKRWLMLPALHAFCAWFWVLHVVLGRFGFQPGPLARMAAAQNDAAKWKGREVRRTYIYSEADHLVDWRDVEAHAGDARLKGFEDVRVERFNGTAHVAHARGDQERYWRLVRETWEGVD